MALTMSTSEMELTLETNIVMPTSIGGPAEKVSEGKRMDLLYTFVVGPQSLVVSVD
jgi:hypothetical protein